MANFRIVGFCVLFLLGVLSAAWGEESIAVNHSKMFKGGADTSRFLSVNLATEKSTRVHIVVTRAGEILEYHRLVTGPKGVWDGRNKGAKSWGCVLPNGAKGKDYQATVFVMPMGAEGTPVEYQIKEILAGESGGFKTASVDLK